MEILEAAFRVIWRPVPILPSVWVGSRRFAEVVTSRNTLVIPPVGVRMLALLLVVRPIGRPVLLLMGVPFIWVLVFVMVVPWVMCVLLVWSLLFFVRLLTRPKLWLWPSAIRRLSCWSSALKCLRFPRFGYYPLSPYCLDNILLVIRYCDLKCLPLVSVANFYNIRELKIGSCAFIDIRKYVFSVT